MRQQPPHRRSLPASSGRLRLALCVITVCLCLPSSAARGAGLPEQPEAPLRVAVYNVAPYGSVSADGLFSGVSVELWRRVAEDLHLPYRFTPVKQMDDVIAGLENGRFDAAIGAITITPERLDRVDFSYPAHRSGVAVAFQKRSGPMSAMMSWGTVVSDHASLIGITLALLLLTGTLMWRFERKRQTSAAESSVSSLFDGVYWAVVTMTTVGYGDKTPKTGAGRFVAVLWMLASLALISLVSTSIVSNMTAARMEAGPLAHDGDLTGKRLAAVASSSGAEYLDSQHLPYTKFDDLHAALTALANGQSDAVVNSIGALQYMIATKFYGVIPAPGGVLAPAYMAFALPPNSPLKKPLDQAMIRVTASADWRSLEEGYFER